MYAFFSLNKPVTQLLNLLARAFIVLTIETTCLKTSIKTEKIQCVHNLHVYAQHIAPLKFQNGKSEYKTIYRRPSDNSHKLQLQHMVGIGVKI